MFARLPDWARADGRRTVRLSRRQGYLIALAGLLAAVCLLGACAVSATGGGANAEASVRPLASQAQSATTRLANAASTPLAAATATTEPTARPTITPRPTATPQATVTPQPTATPQSTATPQATATPNTTQGFIVFPGKTNSDAAFAFLSIIVLLLCFAVIGLIVWLVARNSAARHAAAQQQAATSAAMAGPGMTPGMTPGPPGTQSEWEQTERYRTETPGMPPTYPQGPQMPPPGAPPNYPSGQPPYQGGQPYQGEGGQPPEQPNQYQQRDEY